MNLNPLSLALVNPRGRWGPIGLWANNDFGFYGDPAQASSLFTTFDGTTNVTSPGDPIGRWARLAGSFDWSQSVSGSRPLWSRMPKNGLFNLFTTATDTFTTRNFTTSAVQYTLSFRGTGTITLSGTSTAGPLVGTGANDRVSLTFTPTAGTLTLTVSGSVLDGQIVFGAAARDYQSVASASDVTQVGQPSVWLPYHNGSAWFDSGAQSFGSASLFADAGQEWTNVFLVRTFGMGATVSAAKAGATLATRTYQCITNSVTGRLTPIIRGTVTEVAGANSLTDGDLHLCIMRWDGTTLTAFVDGSSAQSVAVGSAAEESENIVCGARTASSPAAGLTGRNLNWLIDRALTNAEIDRLRAYIESAYGINMS